MLEHECEGAKFHSPRPRQIQRHFLAGRQAVYLCGTCRDNLDVYITAWEEQNGLTWEEQRTFGNKIRQLGDTIIRANRKS